MRITDSQIHLWTGGTAPPHHWRSPFSIDDALREMNEAGIEAALNHPPNWDPASIDYAAEAARAHPDRFATLGWFELGETSDEETLDNLMSMPGMLGLRFILPMPNVMSLLGAGKLEWLWAVANERELPVGLFILPDQVSLIADIAARHPKMRLLIDHMGVPPFTKLPQAAGAVEAIWELARLPNVAVKASGVPSMATGEFPFPETHELLRKTISTFGAQRVFWGTDYTRIKPDWRACAEMFTKHLDWLSISEQELVMGAALRDWVDWPSKQSAKG